MKPTDIRKKNPTDLAKLVVEHETEPRGTRFGTASGGSKNVRRARAIRKDIARIKTILNEK